MTAVEWLLNELMPKSVSLKTKYIEDLKEQAKEMHKQEIIEAWEDGIDSFSTRSSEQYYQETFKK